MWSVGCIIYELITGKTLFGIKESDEDLQNFEHLALMIKYFGKMPADYIDEGHQSDVYFTESRKPKLKNKRYKDINPRPLKLMLEEAALPQFKDNPLELELFCNFLTKCFRYWPKQRPSAKDLLNDEWFDSVRNFQVRKI